MIYMKHNSLQEEIRIQWEFIVKYLGVIIFPIRVNINFFYDIKGYC